MDSIFLDLGILQIQWYSVFVFLGLFFGGLVALSESKRFNIAEDFMINLFFYMIPIAIIGARLYYVLFNFDYYSINQIEIFRLWNGGLAIHGGLLFGFIWILFYSKKHKVNTVRLVDIIAGSLLIGQAIGRWGNFFNQEAYGSVVSLEFLESIKLPQFIIDGMFINGAYHHPTFLYESLLCILGFVVLLFVRRIKYIKIGQITGFYLVWYGLVRYFVEALRTDSLMFGVFKAAQLVSILMIIVGIFWTIYQSRGSVFEHRYNEGGGFDESKY